MDLPEEMENSGNKPIVAPLSVGKSEICCVTSTNLPTRTFFAQLCKFTTAELLKLDADVNDHCVKKLQVQPELRQKKIHRGDYVCAKYRQDGCWYRAQVLDRFGNKDERTYQVQMIDYGNFQLNKPNEIMTVDPEELPCFGREPFGINCSILDSDTVDEEDVAAAFNSMLNDYLLINIINPANRLHYIVDIPKLCYNMPFWDKFDPETAERLRKNPHHFGRKGGRAIQASEPLLDGDSADEPSASIVPGL